MHVFRKLRPESGLHYRQLILLIALLLSLSACSLRPDPQRMLGAFAAQQFQAVETDTTRLGFLQAIINYRSIIHNDFYTFSYYPDKVGKLNPYQGRDLKLLWHSQLQQFDESLKPCEEQLQQVPLAQYFRLNT